MITNICRLVMHVCVGSKIAKKTVTKSCAPQKLLCLTHHFVAHVCSPLWLATFQHLPPSIFMFYTSLGAMKTFRI